ncbi:MAG TPA: hypothetical protein VMU50_19495 [Polyangia bacterium]|nr:hypothetical protein [Polyangia bacterium]
MAVTTEEDKHFSDSMLQWMAEGDRLHEDPKHGGFSGEGAAPRSRRLWVAAACAIALVTGGRFALQHLGATGAPVAEAASPQSATATATVALAPSALPAAVGAVPEAVTAPGPAVSQAVAGNPTAEPAIEQAKPAAAEPRTQALAAKSAPVEDRSLADKAIAETPAVAPQHGTLSPAGEAAPAPPSPAPVIAAPALAADPPAEDFETLLKRCREAIARERWVAARAACGVAQQQRPDSPDVLTRLAEIALNRGQGRAALRFANAALTSDPAFADAYVIVGSVQQNENRTVEARAAYSQYLKLAPSGRYASDLRAILATL